MSDRQEYEVYMFLLSAGSADGIICALVRSGFGVAASWADNYIPKRNVKGASVRLCLRIYLRNSTEEVKREIIVVRDKIAVIIDDLEVGIFGVVIVGGGGHHESLATNIFVEEGRICKLIVYENNEKKTGLQVIDGGKK